MYYARIMPLVSGIDRRTPTYRNESRLIAAIKREVSALNFMGRYMVERYVNGQRVSCTIEG